jgi:hypothetical protein
VGRGLCVTVGRAAPPRQELLQELLKGDFGILVENDIQESGLTVIGPGNTAAEDDEDEIPPESHEVPLGGARLPWLGITCTPAALDADPCVCPTGKPPW